MSSKLPIVRQVAWLSIIPQFAIMALFYFALQLAFTPDTALLAAASIYLLLSLFLRYTIAHHHRKGFALFKKGQYEEAIKHFHNSYDYFTKNQWVDQWRFITMFSSSRMSYREVALLNIGFCYSQIGDGKNAKKYYEETLKYFPDSKMAQTALQALTSMEKKD